MSFENSLILIAITLPIILALLIRYWGKVFKKIQRQATTITFFLVLSAVLFRFLLNRQYECIYLTGKETCAFVGIGSISTCLLSIISGLICLLRESNERHDYIFLLLLNSTWAGIVLTDNLLLTIISFSLLLIVVSGWIKARGLHADFLILRDDYKNDWGPK